MQIHSVTEHISNLNREIDIHVEFINNVIKMRNLQKLIIEVKEKPLSYMHIKMGSGLIQLNGELADVVKRVDGFIIERLKNNG